MPSAEARGWIAWPTLVLGEKVALSAEERREMVPAPAEAQRILTLTAAEASRITSIAVTAFEPIPLIDGPDRLDLAVIGLIPEDSTSQIPTELPGSRTLRDCRVPRIPLLRLRPPVCCRAGTELRSLPWRTAKKP